MFYTTSNFSKSREWSMGGRYDITNRGKDEEITHSTYISRSMGEGIREEWNIYLSIRFLGRSGENVQVLRTFSPIIGNKMFQFSWNIYVPYQKRTYFWERSCWSYQTWQFIKHRSTIWYSLSRFRQERFAINRFLSFQQARSLWTVWRTCLNVIRITLITCEASAVFALLIPAVPRSVTKL